MHSSTYRKTRGSLSFPTTIQQKKYLSVTTWQSFVPQKHTEQYFFNQRKKKIHIDLLELPLGQEEHWE